MNILVLAGEIPATNNMPGSPRLFSLCKALSQQHHLTLVSVNQNKERYEAFVRDPTSAGVFQAIVLMNSPPHADWRSRQIHRLCQEVHFVTRYRAPKYHKEQCQKIHDIFIQGGFDVLYVDGLPMAQYVIDSRLKCPSLIDLHDCLTLFYNRKRRLEPNWRRRLALYAETRSIERWERSLSRVFSAIIINSAIDAGFFRTLDPSANTLIIGNGVDSDFFRPNDIEPDIFKLIFTGVMNYGPNEDAAVYFCDAILPLIRERFPQVEFWITGMNPTEKVCDLARLPNVHVTGGVPDIRPYLQMANIFVCPIRYGTGIKNKLLAALAMQKTVVATRLSIDGLDLKEDEDLVIVDKAEDFAAKVIRLIEEPAYAKRLGQSGYATVKAKYSWESSANSLEKTLRSLVAKAVVPFDDIKITTAGEK